MGVWTKMGGLSWIKAVLGCEWARWLVVVIQNKNAIEPLNRTELGFKSIKKSRSESVLEFHSFQICFCFSLLRGTLLPFSSTSYFLTSKRISFLLKLRIATLTCVIFDFQFSNYVFNFLKKSLWGWWKQHNFRSSE